MDDVKRALGQFLGRAEYDAASYGRRLAGWRPPSSGPQRAVEGLVTLRNRSRDVARNSPAAAAALGCWVTSIIGTGVVPRPLSENTALKQKLVGLWDAWAAVADADTVVDFAGLQKLVVRSWLESGECFIRLRPRRLDDGLPVPMQVQVLESDFVPLLDADSWPGLPAGNFIRQGIEFNGIGKRVAYWMHRSHPGDRPAPNADASEPVRVPADNVLHVFDPQRPGQLRGVPLLAPALAKLRTVEDFDDAVLERQRLANLFVGFVVTPNAGGANDPMTGMPRQGPPDAPLLGLEPGLMQELDPGQDIRFNEPPEASANYDMFLRRQLSMVASATGMPYELLTGDIREVSDRTLRISLNEYRRACEQRLWTVIVPKMLQPCRDAWAFYAFMAGVLTQAEAEEARRVRWSPQGWAYIHPVQDVQARRLEVEAGFRSRSDVIAERGDDADTVDAERAADSKRAARLGIAQAEDLAAERAKAEANAAKAEAEAAKANAEAAREAARTDAVRRREAEANSAAISMRQRHLDEIAGLEREAALAKAKVARLEIEAAEIGLAELRGES